MAELRNKYSERVVFPSGKQKAFVLDMKEKLGIDIEALAKLLKVHPRTLRDWRREKFLMPLSALKTLCKLTNSSFPREVKIRKPFWYVDKGSKKGWVALIKKYGKIPGDPIYRKKKWYEWWEKKGKFNLSQKFRPLPIHKPRCSKELAEFFGIMMGDGGLSQRQLSITLHHIDDLEYSKFVVRLVRNLFDVVPAVYHIPSSSVNRIVVSRTSIVDHLHSLGLPIGDKMRAGLDIPGWIKINNKYLVACVRGLVDTDGCIFTHQYKVNGKWYAYKKLAFTTMSTPLRKTVFKVLQDLDMNPQISQQRDVRLNSVNDMRTYFKLVGSHNPKHLNKYYK